jgi:hypothetical protein
LWLLLLLLLLLLLFLPSLPAFPFSFSFLFERAIIIKEIFQAAVVGRVLVIRIRSMWPSRLLNERCVSPPRPVRRIVERAVVGRWAWRYI